jgi:hypothetical protein
MRASRTRTGSNFKRQIPLVELPISLVLCVITRSGPSVAYSRKL